MAEDDPDMTMIFILHSTIPTVLRARDKPALCMPGEPLPAELRCPLEWHESRVSSLREQVDSSGNQEHNGLSRETVAKEIVSL